MKKILIIGILLLCVTHIFAQSKTVEGSIEPLTTNVETNRLVSTNAATSIVTLDSEVAGSKNYIYNMDGDTLFATFEGTTLKLLAVDSETSDTEAPYIGSAEVGTVEDSLIYITLNESVDSIVASIVWTVRENGVEVGVDTMAFSGGNQIILWLDSAMASGATLDFDYTRPRNSGDIQDASGNYLATFTNQGITNNVTTACSEVGPATYYDFENSTADSSGNGHTLTANGGAGYDAGEFKTGAWGADLNGANRYFLRPSRTIGTEWSCSFWFKEYWSSLSGRTAITTLLSNQGIEISLYSDGTTGQIRVTTGDGVSTSIAYSNPALDFNVSLWNHVAVVVNSAGVTMYYNNVNVTYVSLVKVGFGGATTARIGLDYDDGGDFYGFIDGLREFDGNLTVELINDLYTTPAGSANLVDCGDPPIPDVDIIEYWRNDPADYAIQQTIPKDTLIAHMPNFASMASDGGDDVYNYVDVVDFNAKRWFKNWYLQGHCCTESTYEDSWNGGGVGSGGTGWDPRAWVTDATTKYKELYISYRVYWDASIGDFVVSGGHKLPGLQPEINTLLGVGRIMNIKSSEGYGDMLPAYYTHAYWRAGGYDDPEGIQKASSFKNGYDWFVSGRDIIITVRMYYGTVEGFDGFMELFIDGIFIKGQGIGAFRPGDGRYGIPFHPDTGPDGWGMIQMSTFMGGEGEDYQAIKDEWMLLGEIVVWDYDDDVSDVPRWDDANPESLAGRSIIGALTTLGFYD